MQTKIIQIDSQNIDLSLLDTAAKIITGGGLAAFPTETVYGLGANAFDTEAIKKIYEVKGRPSDNPLIIHISKVEELSKIAYGISIKAEKLIKKFWPGPITFIFKKKEIIPYEASGGLDTVAIRLPRNEIARILIEKAGVPIAAPSANSSGKPSPTRASHVEYDISGKIEMIIDGGGAELGIESTVLDLTGEVPIILRPGSVTKEDIEAVVGEVKLASINSPVKSPGMKYTHYSPNAELTLVKGDLSKIVETINELVLKDKNVGILATEQTKDLYKNGNILVVGDRERPETIAANLFKLLRKFDYMGISKVYAEGFDEKNLEFSIMNRLQKAANNVIIKEF